MPDPENTTTTTTAAVTSSVPASPSLREIREMVESRTLAEQRAAEAERRAAALEKERDEHKAKAEQIAAEREKERAEATARQVKERRDTAIEAAAKAAGAHNPKDVIALLAEDAVKVGANGELEGLTAAMEALAKERAYLFKPKTSGDTSAPPPPGDGKFDARTASPAEWAARRAALLKAR